MSRVDVVEVAAEPNVSVGWETSDEWRRWEAPWNAIRGELAHQDALHDLAGLPRPHGYLIPIDVAIERDVRNVRDPTAWTALASGHVVGRLDPAIARALSPPMDRAGYDSFVVAGLIRGGSLRSPSLGVHLWLGRRITRGPVVVADADRFAVPWPPGAHEGERTVRTGLSEQSWWLDVDFGNPVAAIRRARSVLTEHHDPLERHYAYVVLERALYQCRDDFTSALDEFEDACLAHDAEMERIVPALVEEFGGIPVLPTYRQMAIRLEKAGRLDEAAWWCRRGIEWYGSRALHQDAVADLEHRLAEIENEIRRR